MDQSRQDAGLASRTLTRLGLNEGVPPYLAALAVFLLLLILGAVH